MQNPILALAGLTLLDPKKAAATVLRMPLGRPILTEALLLVAILSVLVAAVTNAIDPPPHNLMTQLFSNPLLATIIQAALLFLTVLSVFLIGRSFGGTGSFDDTLRVMVWLQFVSILLQAVEVPFYFLDPGLASMITFATAIFVTWLTANFIAVLHGFKSLLKVFAGMFGVSMMVAIALLTIFGSMGLIGKGA